MRSAAPLDIPRWEWRTFAPFDGERLKAQLGSQKGTETASREVSILCSRSKHDVLIHDDAIRLKWRKQVSPDGLELWDSVFAAAFPCQSEVLLRLFEAWGLPGPAQNRTVYSREQFLAEILPQHPELQPIEINKRSQTFLLDGISCELSELTVHQANLACFCIEHEDPELMLQVLHRLGLQRRPSTSYPEGLKAALKMAPPR